VVLKLFAFLIAPLPLPILASYLTILLPLIGRRQFLITTPRCREPAPGVHPYCGHQFQQIRIFSVPEFPSVSKIPLHLIPMNFRDVHVLMAAR
jgi:hypothetical protein